MTGNSIRDEFFAWLSEKVSPAQLSEYFVSCADVESFCIQENILDGKLFDITDLNTLNNFIRNIIVSKKFRLHYKRSLERVFINA